MFRKIRYAILRRRSRRYWKQFQNPGKTIGDQTEFAKENLTTGTPTSLWQW